MSSTEPSDEFAPRRPTQRPKQPGILATEEEHAAYAKAEAEWIKACGILREGAFGGLKPYDTMPYSTWFHTIMRKRALEGDTRWAQHEMDSIAERIEKGHVNFSEVDRMFLAIALRRIAADPKAAAVVSAAATYGGKPGRPEENRKGVNTAIALAIELKKGLPMEEAIFSLLLKNRPYVPKDRRGIQRAWAKWSEEATNLVEELLRNPEVAREILVDVGQPDPFADK